MKNYQLGIVIALLCVATGCQNSTDDNLSINKVNNVMTLTGASQKLAYQMLTPNEKVTIWTNKLQGHLMSNFYNSNQKALISELKDQINSGILEKDRNEITKFQNSWLKRASASFSKPFLYKIAFSISDKVIVFDAPAKCECNKESVFSCTIDDTYTCQTSNCIVQSYGCGFLWSYVCDGMCKWHL
ncbi:hypothetical protein WSM22_35750 [Cytophagales bacterium WSM2-2]|nr:hypothetical protein WSM22_35750 [Cytophagales bacterium WSM2-2]